MPDDHVVHLLVEYQCFCLPVRESRRWVVKLNKVSIRLKVLQQTWPIPWYTMPGEEDTRTNTKGLRKDNNDRSESKPLSTLYAFANEMSSGHAIFLSLA